jgi:hypothetical protein
MRTGIASRTISTGDSAHARLLGVVPVSDRAVAPLVDSNFVKAAWRLAVELHHRRQQFARLLHLALGAPEAREAHGGAEF